MTGTAIRQLQTEVALWTPSPTNAPLVGTPPTVAPCYFNWATQDLPQLTAAIQSAMDDAGLENLIVRASAYGENCYTYDTNEVQYFATMETDFHVTAQVESLDDEAALGDLVAQILAVLGEFPPGETPGPMPGQIMLAFVQGAEQRFASVTVSQAGEMVTQGLKGVALWNALSGD